MEELLEKIERLKEFRKALIAPKPPQINTSPKAPGLPKPPSGDLKLPKPPTGKGPSSKKNPAKVAQQLKEPSQKKFAMKQAKESLSTNKNGQWNLS